MIRVKTLLVKLGAITVCIGFTVLGVYVLLPGSKYALMAALIDKHELLETTPSPKIILVGGSSSAFGLDSYRITNAIGHRYEVINTALHGGLGLRFMLTYIEDYLAPGDVVVIIPEYTLLYDTHRDATALNEGLGEFPKAWQYVSLTQDKIMPSTILLTIQKRARKFLGLLSDIEDLLYTRRGFNRYGDLISHLQVAPRREIKPAALRYLQPTPRVIKMINNFYAFCQQKDVQVLMTFAPFPLEYKVGREKGETWVHSLQQVISIPIISNPDDYLLPLEYFYDTVYHLNGSGRQIRTNRLIKDLRQALCNGDCNNAQGYVRP